MPQRGEAGLVPVTYLGLSCTLKVILVAKALPDWIGAPSI